MGSKFKEPNTKGRGLCTRHGSTHIPDVAHLCPGEDLLWGRIHRVARPLLGHELHQLRGYRGLSGGSQRAGGIGECCSPPRSRAWRTPRPAAAASSRRNPGVRSAAPAAPAPSPCSCGCAPAAPRSAPDSPHRRLPSPSWRRSPARSGQRDGCGECGRAAWDARAARPWRIRVGPWRSSPAQGAAPPHAAVPRQNTRRAPIGCRAARAPPNRREHKRPLAIGQRENACFSPLARRGWRGGFYLATATSRRVSAPIGRQRSVAA